MVVLLGKIHGRHYNYREILPGVTARKSSAPHNLLRRPRYLRPDINIPESLDRIRRFRENGFGVAYDLSSPNVGALAWPVARSRKTPLILGIWGPATRIKARESQVIADVQAALAAAGAARP